MAVPTFAAISDSEIAPGDPALSSVFVRLRNNPLAVFGVDTSDPSPSVNPPRQLVYSDNYDSDGINISGASTSGITNGPWINLCDDDDVGSIFRVRAMRPSSILSVSISINSSSPSFDNSLTNSSGTVVPPPTGDFIGYAMLFSPVYSAGAFAGVEVLMENLHPFTQSLTAPAVASGIILDGGPAIVAPNATEDLLRITTGVQYVALKMQHQTVGSLQRFRFIADINRTTADDIDVFCMAQGECFVTNLKG